MKHLFKAAALLLCFSAAAQNLLPENASNFDSGMPQSNNIKFMWRNQDYKVVPNVGRNGSSALEMTLSPKSKRVLIHPDNRSFKAGETVTATVWIKGDKAGGPILLLLWGTNKFWNADYQSFVHFNVTAEWKQYKITRKLPKDLKYLGVMVAGATARDVTKVYIDDVFLTSDTKIADTAQTVKKGNLLPPEASGFEGELPPHPTATAMWNRNDIRITSDISYCGAKSLEFTISPKTKRVVFFPKNEMFKKGETVTASAYIRGDKAGGPVLLYLWGTDKLWNPARIQKFTHGPVTQEWKQFVITAEMPADINVLGVMVAASTTQGTTKLYIDEVKLERGSSATPSIANRKENISSLNRNSIFVIPFSSNQSAKKELAVTDFFSTETEKITPPPQPTAMYLSADREYLYFRFRCSEENPGKIKCKSAYDTPDWNDDRVELHLSMAGSILRPNKGYFSINADGIYFTYYRVKREELDIKTSRGKNYWEVSFRLPFRAFGFEANQGSLWRISAGRFHRTSKQGTSALAPIKGHFNREEDAFKNFVLSSDGKLPAVILAVTGDMVEHANITGSNAMVFDFSGKVNPADWSLKINDKKMELLEGKGNQLTYLYQVKGGAGEKLTFQLSGKNGVAASGTFTPAIFNPASRVYPTKDPLFKELLGEKRSTPRQHMTWGMLFDKRCYHQALKTGIVYSEDQIYKDLKKSGVRLMIQNAAEVWENLPEMRKGNYFRPGTLKTTGLTDYARMYREGKILPTAWYSFYGIAGVDKNNNYGITWRKAGYGGMPLDPINRKAYLAMAKGVAERSREGSVGIYFFGDELTTICSTRGLEMNQPFNKNSTNYLEKWNEDVKRKEGDGRFGIPWGMKADDPRRKPSMLAYDAYMASELAELGRETRDLIKKINPNLIFLSDDAFGNPSGHGVQYWIRYADWGSFQLGEGGGTSGLDFPTYMFTTKLVRDMSGLDELMVCPHEPVDGYPSGAMGPEDIIEAYSQCIRGGATGFHFWPAAFTGGSRLKANAYCNAIGYPTAYKYMLYYADLLNKMPNLKFPETKTAVLVVDDTIRSDNKFTRLRGVFSLIGLKPSGWFHFISDTHIRNEWRSLKNYSMCYIPAGSILRKETIEKLEEYVRNGGTLICADPEFGKYNQFLEQQKGISGRLFGISMSPVKNVNLAWNKVSVKLDGDIQKLTPVAKNGNVLARYSDGSIAGYERKLGKGKTIFFGFDLFLPSNVEKPGLSDQFTALHRSLGGKTGHDIWRFKLPAPNFPEETLPGEKCLTGNYGFWNRNYFHTGRLQNVVIPGTIKITRAGAVPVTEAFDRSKLVDRLSYFRNTASFDKTDGEKYTEIFDAGTHKIEVTFSKPVKTEAVQLYYNGVAEVNLAAEENGTWKSIASAHLDAGKNEVLASILKGRISSRHYRITLTVPPGKRFTFAELDIWGTPGK